MLNLVELNGNLYFRPNQTISLQLNMQNPIYRKQKSASTTIKRFVSFDVTVYCYLLRVF